MAEFNGSSEKLKREMLDIIGKVRALRLNPSGAGAQSAGRPLEKMHEETKQVIEVHPAGTFEMEIPVSPRSVETIPTVKVKSTTDTKTVSLESKKAEILEQILVPEQKQIQPSKETEAKKPPLISVGIELFYPKDEEIDPKIAERLKKVWESFIPRDTFCPYCRKPVLSIDNTCPHCGAVNI
jgi:hypothetical protein